MLTPGPYFFSKYKGLKYPTKHKPIPQKYNKEELNMAKSFIDQLLEMVGLKTSGAHGQYSPSAYRNEQQPKIPEDGSTGVARYLAKLQQEAAAETAKVTGVARYLAKMQQEDQEKAAAEAAALAKMTGVARYLAKLEQETAAAPGDDKTESANTPKQPTGVEKYLSRVEEITTTLGGNKTETAEPANTQKPTGVEKYLSRQQSAPSDKPQPEAVQQEAKAKVTEQKSVVEEKKAQPEQAPEKKSTSAAKKSDKVIDLAKDATQCQSATSKSTQCRRKTNLETLDITIDRQKYRFVACSQHHSDAFVPFAELLQEG
ncbi:hypothetical protein [Methylobacter sp. sgz302048]|uniref:hypothetical protein n=1 Tax=Methylobacter sp. sgz302048 TaxID=3455945 RepID=UPI003F9FEE80